MTTDVNRRLLPRLAKPSDQRILFVVLDGLGGLLGREPTALQASRHPHLDALATESALGRHIPISEGITPGSGPGHFACFGYDPLALDVGRGVLEALGLGVGVGTGDVAIRGNFCTLDGDGIVRDRRAGRIPTDEARPLVDALNAGIGELEGVRVEVHPGLQHRFAVVLRGEGLGGAVTDTDPQVVGERPLAARALDAASEKTARIADAFVARAREILGERDAANGVMLRGFGTRPPIQTLKELAGLRACAVAAYPAYRGVAHLLGMDVRTDLGPTSTIAQEVDVLEAAWKEPFDFFFLHVKGTDSAGEDGDESRKGEVIEQFDAEVPRLRALEPDVIIVTGDHATPGPLAAHAWHPVPFLLYGPWCEPDGLERFDEAHCVRGHLGSQVPATALLRLALANAGKLAKYGA
ncbi:MAG: 2,3-bisphosphoglycerate-independent phosphoglycerate mutase [Planctomycetota bacterium]|jgi:2,3-bisphosphoglycerate-independent phosphoglycerate mutase